MKATADGKKKPDIHLASAGRARLPLGEVLVKSGAITQEQLQDALKQQKNHPGVRLGRLLVKLGFVGDDTVRQAISTQLGMTWITSV